MTMDTVPMQCNGDESIFGKPGEQQPEEASSGKSEQSVDEKQASGPPKEAISGTPEQDATAGKPEPETNSRQPEGQQQDSIVAAGDAASSEVVVATARCSFCGDLYRTSAMKLSGKAKAGAEAKYRCKACATTGVVLA